MSESTLTGALLEAPVLGIVRSRSVEAGVSTAEALVAGGLKLIEVSLTSANAIDTFARAKRAISDSAVLGVGTVRTMDDARVAIDAGAQFLVSPCYAPEVTALAAREAIPMICGVLTPTEIQRAVNDGIEWLKIFPAGGLGATYVAELRAPFPEPRFIPTGGIRLEDVRAFREAGADAVGLAGALLGSSPDATSAAARTSLQLWAAAS